MVVVAILLAAIYAFAVKLILSVRPDRDRTMRNVAFFHPFCDHGGGGERVLWVAIAALLKARADVRVVIYISEECPELARILANVQAKFGIHIPPEHANRLLLVPFWSYVLLSADLYPVATMLGQSVAAVVATLECLLRFCPDVYCDTMGAAFGYPVAKLLGCKVVAYTHYPHISKDMLQRVREQRPSFNNHSAISSSVAISSAKLLYYHAFALAYGAVGRCADTAMVNSSWTMGHIQDLWGFSSWTGTRRRLRLVFPPCNTAALQTITLSRPLVYTRKPAVEGVEDSDGDENLLQMMNGKIIGVSVGQFRPEKDHFLQLRVMEELVRAARLAPGSGPDVLLVMVGSVRNDDDKALVDRLVDYIRMHDLSGHVHLMINSSHAHMQRLLSIATFGLHTMWNEHFGISVVEKMAAGVVVIAHNSGGPASDIVTPSTGFLASTADEYARCVETVLAMPTARRLEMQELARESAARFSDAQFEQSFCDELLSYCPPKE